MVERFLAKEGVGARFPLPAPRKDHHESGDFFFGEIERVEDWSICALRKDYP